MRFNEINLFGLYVAPITPIMAVAWAAYLVVRRTGDRFGLTQRVWHPALFELALYVINRLLNRPYDCALEPLMSGVEPKTNDAKTLPGIKRPGRSCRPSASCQFSPRWRRLRLRPRSAVRHGNITWARPRRATARSAPMS
jgi:protein AaeX